MPRMMSVLQAVSAASREIGIAQKNLSQALGSNDEDVLQMTALLSAVADELLLEEPYQDMLGDGNWLIPVNSLTGKDAPTADTDLILFDGRLAVSGLKYRFLHGKGLEYAEHLRDFSNRLAKIATRANNRVLDLNEEESRVV